MATDAISIHTDAAYHLKELADRVSEIQKAFLSLADPSGVKESPLEGYPNLAITTTEDQLRITITHFGTTINFECLMSFSPNNEVFGRVICTLQHSIWGSQGRELLGAFTLTRGGITDFAPQRTGHLCTIQRDADLIVAYFLHRAHAANFTLQDSKNE